MHLVAYTEAPTLGGADISLSILLAALDERIDVTVAGVEEAVVERVAAARRGARSALVPAVTGRRDVRAILAQARALHRLRPDVLHMNLHTPVAARYAVLSGVLMPRVRVIVVEQLATRTPPTRGQKLLKQLTGRRLAAHVAVGERAARSIEKLFGLRQGSIGVVHNAVPDRQLRRLPRVTDAFVVGSVGRLDGQKGYDVLVRALAEVPDVTAVLVGDGPEREALRELAREVGVADRLVLAGWQDDARDHLTTFDAFALPSRFEGFPLALLEAMLAELPVVATDVGSVAEAVLDGDTGCLLEPEDVAALAGAIRSLRDDERLRARLGAAARAHVLSNFSPDASAHAFERLYSGV